MINAMIKNKRKPTSNDFSDYSGALHPSDVTTIKLLYANAGAVFY